MALPLGTLRDLFNIRMVHAGAATYEPKYNDDRDVIPDVP